MTEETQSPNGSAYTAAADYPGYARPIPVTLPSGAKFILRVPSVPKMLRKGQIPNPLMEIINDVFQERDEAELAAEAEHRGITKEEVIELRQIEEEHDRENEPPEIPITSKTAVVGLAFRDVMIWAAIVQPEVEFEAPASDDSPLTANGKLSYDALAEEDLNWIMAWINRGGVDDVATFPPDVGRESDSGGGGTVRTETEQPARPAA